MIGSSLDQMWVAPQCGRFTELPVSTDRRNTAASVDIPALTGSPVAGHLIEIAPIAPPRWSAEGIAIGCPRLVDAE